MLLVARKNLFSERTRLAISVGGVALSVLLISLLLSLYRGWDERVGGFVEDSSIDVWIGSEGSKDFLSAASLLPFDATKGPDPCVEAAGEAIRSGTATGPPIRVEDVQEYRPMIIRPMEGVRVKVISGDTEKIGAKMDLQFIGFDLGTRLGGPIKIVEGEGNPTGNQVVVDEALSKRFGVDVGDILRAGGRDWDVIGKSSGGDFIAVQTVFVSFKEAQDALGYEGKTTFWVTRLKKNADPDLFVASITDPKVVAFTRADFAENTRQRILSNVLPILLAVLGLAFIVGLAVAGLTIYTATVEKAREYGILKAVGFKNSYLYRVVLEQSLVTGVLGFAIGAGLTVAVSPFARDFVPQFVTFVKWQDILAVAGATLVMSAIAAYVPVRRLASIDPVAVFKA